MPHGSHPHDKITTTFMMSVSYESHYYTFLCMYRAFRILFLFQPTMHNIYIFYFNNIYIIITPKCFVTFVPLSGSSKVVLCWSYDVQL